MGKKVIQVPIDEGLLSALDEVSTKQRKARAEVIRQACQRYLKELKTEELDALYRQGYEKFPDEAELGPSLLALASEVLSSESW